MRAVRREHLVECWQLDSMQAKLRPETLPAWVRGCECQLVFDEDTGIWSLSAQSVSPRNDRSYPRAATGRDGDYLLHDEEEIPSFYIMSNDDFADNYRLVF